MTRKRPRKPRVVREPIDLEQLAAEFADLADAPEPQEPRIDEQEILVALEAEVQRLSSAKVAEVEIRPEPEPEPVADPFGIVSEPTEPTGIASGIMPASRVGLPLDQVRAWLEHVEEDLRRIQARVQQLEAEQVRLQEQHHIVAELLTSSTPV